MNINDLDEYEIESSPIDEASDKPLNIADLEGSYEVEEPVSEESDVSPIESAARGFAQGATLGFSDELTGAGEAALKTLVGPDKIRDVLDNYKKYRDESRRNYEKAEQANPNMYFAGELGGGIGTGIISGGGSTLANLGKTGLTAAMKQGAKSGLIQGAGAGLGMSKSDLTEGEVEEAAKDVALGAGTGFAVGGALPVAIQGAKSLGGLAKEGIESGVDLVKDKSKTLRNILDTYKYAKEGKSVIGDKAKETLIEDAQQTADKLIGTMKQEYGNASRKVAKALEMSETGKKNMSNTMRDIENVINSGDVSQDDVAPILKMLNEYKRTFTKETVTEKGEDVALKQLNKNIELLKQRADKLGVQLEAETPEVLSELGTVQSLVRETTPEGNIVPKFVQQSIPEDTILKETFEGFDNMSVQDLMNLKKKFADIAFSKSDSVSSGAKRSALAGYRKVDTALESRLLKGKPQELFESGNEALSKFHEAEDIIGAVNPLEGITAKNTLNLSQKLLSGSDKNKATVDKLKELVGQKSQGVLDEAADLSRRAELNKLSESSSALFSGSTVQKAGMAVGDIAGTVQKKLSPENFYKAITKIPNEKLASKSQQLKASNSSALKTIGDMIDNAVSNNDPVVRSQLLWALSHQAAFRELMKDDVTE